jgi:hypothetical protein
MHSGARNCAIPAGMARQRCPSVRLSGWERSGREGREGSGKDILISLNLCACITFWTNLLGMHAVSVTFRT